MAIEEAALKNTSHVKELQTHFLFQIMGAFGANCMKNLKRWNTKSSSASWLPVITKQDTKTTGDLHKGDEKNLYLGRPTGTDVLTILVSLRSSQFFAEEVRKLRGRTGAHTSCHPR